MTVYLRSSITMEKENSQRIFELYVIRIVPRTVFVSMGIKWYIIYILVRLRIDEWEGT